MKLTKQLLREGLFTKSDIDTSMVIDFIKFTKKYLGIKDKVKVILAFERTSDLRTTAYYNIDGIIKVYVKDRSIIDILRSIAHELVHHLQNCENRLKNIEKDGADGSPIENESNAKAGEIIRVYGREHPELYK
jgi:hypothetical protein